MSTIPTIIYCQCHLQQWTAYRRCVGMLIGYLSNSFIAAGVVTSDKLIVDVVVLAINYCRCCYYIHSDLSFMVSLLSATNLSLASWNRWESGRSVIVSVNHTDNNLLPVSPVPYSALIQVCAVLLIQDVYPGSRILLFYIPDPGSYFFSSRISDLIFSIPDPVST